MPLISVPKKFFRPTIAVLLLAMIGCGFWLQQRFERLSSRPKSVRRMSPSLLIAGGGPLPSSVRSRFIELAGGSAAHVVIIPAYQPDNAALVRLKIFWRDFDLASLTILTADSHEQADRPEFTTSLDSATGVWISGGTQNYLAERYVDSRVERELQKLLERGGVIGGTSAGASIMTRLMILEGRQAATLARGLDLLPDAVIDQHFMKRNRLARLRGVLEKHPQLIGFGIDESTALHVQLRSGSLQVVGNSYVMAVVPNSDTLGPRIEILKLGDEANINTLRDLSVPVATAYEFEEYISE
jgi:cyanophycinase